VNSADQFREPIDAYALGSLDPEDRAAVAAHLATGCAECTKALGESQWLVSQLAYLAPDAGPSDMLRGRVLKAVRAEAAATAQAPIASATPKSVIPFWMWGAVAATLLFAIYNAYEARTLQKTIQQMQDSVKAQTKLREQSAQELQLARREAVILTDPNSLWISMNANNKDLPVLKAAWHQELGIVVSGWKMPSPSSNRTLQLWLIPKAEGAKPVPSLTLRPGADGKFDLLVANPPDSQGSTKALAITEEPAGGSPWPTSTPIWVGAVASK
jgi:anti-sigma-K factor RskA